MTFPTQATASAVASAAAPTPGLARRLACFVYEGVLLFGLVMAVGLVYGIATGQRDARVGTTGLRIVLFLAIGAYFVHFWSRRGQTLAMRTWHIRLVDRAGRPPSPLRATLRYLLSWLWFVPALALLDASGLHGALPAFATLLAGVLAYAGLARLHPDRQYLHDALCGTRLVIWRPTPPTP